jgi:hypothetical protein
MKDTKRSYDKITFLGIKSGQKKFFFFISVEEILRSVYTVTTAVPDRISQTVPSPSSGNLQTDGPGTIFQTVPSPSSGNLQSDDPCIISQTESSPSSGNLQTFVEQIFRLDRIAWQPDTFLERVGLKLEQKIL